MLACVGIIRNDFHNLQEELVDVSFASVILADVTINEAVDLSSDVLLDEMEGIVPGSERSKRSKMLRILSQKKKHHFYEQNLERQSTILFEEENVNGKILGFSENYVRVATDYNEALVNQLIPGKIKSINEDQYAVAELA